MEAVGPAVRILPALMICAEQQGMNAMQALVTSMTDQLGSMERM